VFLKKDHLQRFSRLLPHVLPSRPEEEKSAVILSQAFPQQLQQRVPLRLILIPRIVRARNPQICPATKGQALMAVAASSLLELPSRGMDGFAKLARLTEQVPSYWLDLVPELDSIPHQVDELLVLAVDGN
jgi:hypothetical protein